MNPNFLVDQPARDAITEDLDRTLFVEAGAGTGKTKSLVDRVVRLLATGRAVAPGIAAITFTEAAAAELRDRLRDALEDAATSGAFEPAERERCEVALGDLDGAAVETIHAFCRRLLASFPMAAGLPPAFDVLDDTESEAAFSEQWENWFESYLDRAAGDESIAVPLLRVLALGGTLERLRGLASTLRGHWDRLDGDALPVPQPDIDLESLLRRVDDMQGLVERCTDPNDRMALHLALLPELARGLREAEDDVAVAQALSRLALTPGGDPWGAFSRTGNSKSWGDGSLAAVRDDVSLLHEDARAILGDVAAGATAEVAREISVFVLATAKERRRDGRLEFQDLLVLTRNLLASQPTVREAIRRRYSHLFIDEFQDTDPLQAEIAFLFGTSAADVVASEWASLPVDDGRLFFVGDPKQSIYRFRRADIDLYQRMRERFESSLVHLTQNFRSVPGVIDWVNAQFEARFNAIEPERQAPHIPLAAARSALMDGPVAHRLGGARDGAMGAIRAEESASIVALLGDIQAGGWLVRSEGGTRPARLEDVAILSGTRTGLRAIVEVLEAGAIPHRIESRSLVYETQEVRDLIALLRAIDDPTDELALIAALRSPAFACGDDDLLHYRAAGGRWDIRQALPPGESDHDAVSRAMEWLHKQHDRRWWIPLAQLVDEVLADLRLLELAFVDRRPRERWQRLRYVAEQARAYSERPEATLRGLINWLQWQAEGGAQVQERVTPEPDDDAVRLMTIHASKGLQFPIVVLIGLGGARRFRSSSVVWNADGRSEVRLTPQLQTAGYEEAQAADRLLDDLELQRLLYVAMTRAEDHLVLSCFFKARGPSSRAQPSIAEEIADFADEHPEICSLLEPVSLPAADTHASGIVEADTVLEQPGDRDAWVAARHELIQSYSKRNAVSATALARKRAEGGGAEDALDAGFNEDASVDETPPWRRGRAGTSIGRAVHSVLQTVDLATGADVTAIAAAQAAAEGVSDRAAEIARLARAALDSEAVRSAVASNRYWREVYVASDVEGVVVDGFIDLLYETPDGYVVVDYKTDSIGAHNVDDVVERYRPQALAYALILSAQLPRPVLRCEFVFVGAPGGAATRVVEISTEALEEIRVLVSA